MSRFRLIAEVHLLLRRGADVLMLRRFATGYEDGKYSVVAGHVDGDETFREAMIREAKEEAGIDVDPRALDLVHTMHRRADDERLSLFFTADAWRGEVRNAEPHKCDDLRFFPLTELPSNVVPYVGFAIDRVLAAERYSEFGWADPSA